MNHASYNESNKEYILSDQVALHIKGVEYPAVSLERPFCEALLNSEYSLHLD